MERKKIVIQQKNTPKDGINEPKREKFTLSGKFSGKPEVNANTSLPQRGKNRFQDMWAQKKIRMSIILVPIVIALIILLISIPSGGSSENTPNAADTVVNQDTTVISADTTESLALPQLLDTSLFTSSQVLIKPNDNLQSVFSKLNLTQDIINELIVIGNENPNLRQLQDGQDMKVYTLKGETQPLYLVYKFKGEASNAAQEITFDLQQKKLYSGEDGTIVLKNQPLLIRKAEDGFPLSILDNTLRFELIEHIEKALKWSIDLWHVSQGDKYQVIYEEIQDKSKKVVGIKSVKAICFETKGRKYYAIAQAIGDSIEYFDINGKSLKGGFLKAPVAIPRITSYFQKNRFHPVDKVFRDHGGTDYGAPENTPIFSVADGVVTEVGSKPEGNGNYIAIKHDDVYSTKYLHMVRWGEGMKQGVKVVQGQVIGYVGQTGKATGPHLCFRFRKNGVEVNPLEETLPSSGTPLPAQYSAQFNRFRDSVLKVFTETKIFL